MTKTTINKTPPQIRAYLASIGKRGGRKGKRADKVRAAKIRWAKAKRSIKKGTVDAFAGNPPYASK